MNNPEKDYVVATVSLGLIYKELVKDADVAVFFISLDELEDLASKFLVEITSDSLHENIIIVNIRRVKQEEYVS
jgi:cytochrome oxidase Cu insertion factor (SCO1/SenC/PrrC family)